MVELVKQLVRIEKDWVPDKPGYSLYVRPLLCMSPIKLQFINMKLNALL